MKTQNIIAICVCTLIIGVGFVTLLFKTDTTNLESNSFSQGTEAELIYIPTGPSSGMLEFSGGRDVEPPYPDVAINFSGGKDVDPTEWEINYTRISAIQGELHFSGGRDVEPPYPDLGVMVNFSGGRDVEPPYDQTLQFTVMQQPGIENINMQYQPETTSEGTLFFSNATDEYFVNFSGGRDVEPPYSDIVYQIISPTEGIFKFQQQ